MQNQFIKLTAVLLTATGFYACKTKKAAQIITPEIPQVSEYRKSADRINDLVHTSLYLQADFKNRELKGKAELTLVPHFYPVDSLMLDAKYMRIESVSIKPKEGSGRPDLIPLLYTYDSLKLRIRLNRRYSRHEQYTVVLQYVAQPEKVKAGGSRAISSRKGLYFINHDGKEAGKPTQMWTQGETEASSCWFPTIDAPNQKTTQEIRITVPARFITVSNGTLLASEMSGDSLRTDYWRQDKPHAPYLFALVAGEFAEIKDKWRERPVNYYVEPAYAPYARLVFGHTPEMIDFFSRRLGYDYPWDKYHQVVVRDFVSGAMENTGCVIHYDKLQHDSREHLDNPEQDIIAHELFHHWFGDLLTCESWSNIPLNESFATYGEYLWNEYKYGRDEADSRLAEFHESYLDEAAQKQVNLIRYHYKDHEDMFDRHSYQKGGAVLHMLRREVGDAAFFEALKLYLHDNAFQTVEISDLRKAFETVTGKDMNWFFEQWFMESGHPHVEVKHVYSKEKGYSLDVRQTGKVFRLSVDVLVSDSMHRLILDKPQQSFTLSEQDAFVLFDAGNQLLGEIKEEKSLQSWKQQMKQATLAAHRIQAFEQLFKTDQTETARFAYCMDMSRDSFRACREAAFAKLNKSNFKPESLRKAAESLKSEIHSEPHASVRRLAVTLFRDAGQTEVLKTFLSDSSYSVLRYTLNALATTDKAAAMAYANAHRTSTHRRMKQVVLSAIARCSDADETDYFIAEMLLRPVSETETYANALGAYLLYNQPGRLDKTLNAFDAALKNSQASERKILLKGLSALQAYLHYQSYYMEIRMQYETGDKSTVKKNISKSREMAAIVEAFYKKQKE